MWYLQISDIYKLQRNKQDFVNILKQAEFLSKKCYDNKMLSTCKNEVECS